MEYIKSTRTRTTTQPNIITQKKIPHNSSSKKKKKIRNALIHRQSPLIEWLIKFERLHNTHEKKKKQDRTNRHAKKKQLECGVARKDRVNKF